MKVQPQVAYLESPVLQSEKRNRWLRINEETGRMNPDMIERDILIEAPVQTVWNVVTEPAQISRWFADRAEIDVRPGGEGTLTFTDRATSQHATVRLPVETVEPPHTFAFRWDYPEDEKAHEGNSSRVEFKLDAHSKGWDAHLAGLRDYVSGQH